MRRSRSCWTNCRRNRRTGQGHRARADLHVRHPARAADPAGRAHLDPRSRHHPGRHRRSGRPSPATRAHRRACPRAPGPPDLRADISPAGYLPLIALSPNWEQAFAESIVGQGDDRTLAMQPSQAVRIHHPGARPLRGGRAQGEVPVLVTSAAHPPLRARHHRALPPPDPGDVARRRSTRARG